MTVANRALLLVALCSLLACNKPPERADEKRTVMVHDATRAPSSGIRLTGEIRARHETELSFRVGGKLLDRLVDTGSEIRAGQALARLDPADLHLAVDAAAAQVAAAESDAANARAERDRHAGLLARKFVSQAAFDSRQHALDAAQARLKQARAQREIASNQAGYGVLKADAAGVVAAVLADTGQVVAPGQPVLRVARTDEMEVLVAVPESQIATLRQATDFSIHLWSAPDLDIPGRLRELGAVADPQTRTYPARISLIQRPPGVQLGMTASVTLANGNERSAILLPMTAVGDHGDGPFVWLVTDGKLHRQPVHLGGYRDRDVEISEGLRGGEKVVIAGLSSLVEGEEVIARTAPEPAAQR